MSKLGVLRWMRWFSALAISISVSSLLPGAAIAVQLSDGKVYFTRPPRLVKASTTQDRVRAWGATYYFVLELPEDAGEPLQHVRIHQHEGRDTLYYELEESYAFSGKSRRRGTPLPLASVRHDPEARAITLTFDPPVTPGQIVTLALAPHYNPSSSGVYLFGVTAFPAGENPHGQFLGFGRLHFYGHGRSLFYPW